MRKSPSSRAPAQQQQQQQQQQEQHPASSSHVESIRFGHSLHEGGSRRHVRGCIVGWLAGWLACLFGVAPISLSEPCALTLPRVHCADSDCVIPIARS
mmetsp:Transcript_3334/g.4567  ORF Transcript_3334/g.4567 Transcript_3334/m.4567 type:complete len:98 (+) Transcript_3334:190-483(+)